MHNSVTCVRHFERQAENSGPDKWIRLVWEVYKKLTVECLLFRDQKKKKLGKGKKIRTKVILREEE